MQLVMVVMVVVWVWMRVTMQVVTGREQGRRRCRTVEGWLGVEPTPGKGSNPITTTTTTSRTAVAYGGAIAVPCADHHRLRHHWIT
uniref:Putative secreted protein n=1 Tax=Anopheles marajoara TaxID=58244 RepID=A0A2M4CB80_9DIPT